MRDIFISILLFVACGLAVGCAGEDDTAPDAAVTEPSCIDMTTYAIDISEAALVGDWETPGAAYFCTYPGVRVTWTSTARQFGNDIGACARPAGTDRTLEWVPAIKFRRSGDPKIGMCDLAMGGAQ